MRGTKTYRGVDSEGLHTWRLRVFVPNQGDPGGRQVSKTIKIAAKGAATGVREAEDALSKFVAGMRADKVQRGNATVRELWDTWLPHLQSLDRSPLTLRDYESAMEKRILPKLGKIKLDDLTAFQLDAFYRGELERGASSGRVIKYHRIMSSMLHQAERWHWISHAPTRDATAPTLKQHEVEPPPIEMVRALVSASGDDLTALLIALAPSTGARRGELVGLRWSDVDFATGVLSISRSAYEVRGGGVATKSTKGGKARRVSLDSSALDALRRARQEAVDQASEFGDELDPDAFIFSDDGEAPWRPDRVTKAFDDIRATVPGAANVRLHDMRHANATMLIAAGVDMVTVSKRLGHAKVSTTSDIYAHALEQRDREAAEIIGRALNP